MTKKKATSARIAPRKKVGYGRTIIVRRSMLDGVRTALESAGFHVTMIGRTKAHDKVMESGIE